MLEPSRISRTQRELRSLIRDVASDDPEAFAELVAISDWLKADGLAEAAAAQRDRGYSWAELARPLGITRQSAQERFSRKAEAGRA